MGGRRLSGNPWNDCGDQRHNPGAADHPALTGAEDAGGVRRQDAAPAITTRSDPTPVKALARAFRYQRLLDEGRYASISEMADREQIERRYLGSLLRLTLLALDIVEAILDGKQPEEIGLPLLLEPFPAVWAEPRSTLERGAHSGPASAD